ncbi:hypothetical protein ACQVP2_07500 [Methylobacterium aquaticum]|uniref:hypothetical protein n=1 Tax=Methylobacterium aquaticum TaxID=270351 RepID=UPI003D1854E5
MASITSIIREALAVGAPGIAGPIRNSLAVSIARKIEAHGQGREGVRLRCTVDVMPDGSTSTRLTFAPGTNFNEGKVAAEAAARALQQEIASGDRCPASRVDKARPREMPAMSTAGDVE